MRLQHEVLEPKGDAPQIKVESFSFEADDSIVAFFFFLPDLSFIMQPTLTFLFLGKLSLNKATCCSSSPFGVASTAVACYKPRMCIFLHTTPGEMPVRVTQLLRLAYCLS